MNKCAKCLGDTLPQKPRKVFLILLSLIVLFLFLGLFLTASDPDTFEIAKKSISYGFLQSFIIVTFFYGNIFTNKYHCLKCNILYNKKGEKISKNLITKLKYNNNRNTVQQTNINIPVYTFALFLVLAPILIGIVIFVWHLKTNLIISITENVSLIKNANNKKTTHTTQKFLLTVEISDKTFWDYKTLRVKRENGDIIYAGSFKKDNLNKNIRYLSGKDAGKDYRKIATNFLNELYFMHTCDPDLKKIRFCINLITSDQFVDFSVKEEIIGDKLILSENSNKVELLNFDSEVYKKIVEIFPTESIQFIPDKNNFITVKFIKEFLNDELSKINYIYNEEFPAMSDGKEIVISRQLVLTGTY